MGLLVTVAGVDRTNKLVEQSLRYRGMLNGRDRLDLAFEDVYSGFRPLDGQELIVYPNGRSYRDEVLSDSPRAYWRLEEASGTTAEDETTNNRDGTYAGSPSLAQVSSLGDASYGVSFDGVDDAVSIASPGLLPNAAVFSVECLFKTDLAATRVIWYQNGSQLFVAANGTLTAMVSDGATTQIDSSAGAIVAGTWYHVLFVSTGTQLELYINGTSAATPVASTRIAATGIFYIGRDAAPAFYPSTVDELAVYDIALSATRALAHANARSRPGRLFGGILTEPEEELHGYSDLIRYQCAAVDYTSICDRHLVPRIYENQTLAAIVKDIVALDLTSEGIGVAGVETGPTFTKVVFNYQPVRECFNELSAQSGFPWTIDANRVLQFRNRAATTAPQAISEASGNWVSLTVRSDRERYRNRQYVRAGVDLTATLTEDFPGDGTTRTFVVAYPVGKVPTIQTDIGAGFVTRTVGIKGVETGKDWYWNKGVNEIVQDSAGTVLGSTHKLRVIYQGMFPIIVQAQSDAEITARMAVEGGAGVYEHVESEPNIDDDVAALDLATALVQRHGVIGKVVSVATLEAGFRSGQLVTITHIKHGLSGQFLIESIEASEWLGLDQPTEPKLLYRFTGLSGDAIGGWQEFFRKLLLAGRTFVIRENEVLLLLRQTPETVAVGDVLSYVSGAPSTLIDTAQIDFSEVV